MTELDLTVSDEVRENGMPYVSKSRIKTYKNCPREFFYKYWCENREPENYYMKRGSEVHRAFEDFHLNLSEYIESEEERPPRFSPLMSDWEDYAQWLEPHVGNFWRFEERRWHESYKSIVGDAWAMTGEEMAYKTLNRWEPIGVEVEGWLGKPPADYDRADPDYVNPDGPPVGDIPWMGFADVILNTASVPGIEGGGVVILDYKTGKVPDERYRESGIFLEGEYYGWLFEEFFDVDGVAGYYPKADELIVSPYPSQERRWDIQSAVLGMQKPPEVENFEINENPLCHYGHGKCFFYDECDSEWGMQGGPGHTKAEPDGKVTA
jgi:hypothetical protein